MSLAAFKTQPDPMVDINDRATPQATFMPLHARFRFTLDVCASHENTKCARYFTSKQDGLARSWAGESVWCNPPFSDIAPWIAKAWSEHGHAAGVVMLIPSTRTEQGWWQKLVEPYRDRPGSPLTVEFLPDRIRFTKPGQKFVGPGERPPFGCCLLIWHRPIPAAVPLQLTTGAGA